MTDITIDPTPGLEDEVAGIQEVLRWLIRSVGLPRKTIADCARACQEASEWAVMQDDYAERLPAIRRNAAALFILNDALRDIDTFANIAAAAEATPSAKGPH